MFSVLKQLLANSTGITLDIQTAGDELKVIVYPKDGSGDKLLKQPLVLVATAEELDEGFTDAILSFTNDRKSLAEQIEAHKIITAQAEASIAKKTTARSSSKPASTVKVDDLVESNSADGDDGDDNASSDDGTASAESTKESNVSIPASGSSSAIDSLADLLS